MFRALYDYAKTHPEIRVYPGTELRQFSYIVDLTVDGQLVGVRAIDKKAPMFMCPSAGSIGTKVDAHPIGDRACISLSLGNPEEEKNPEKLQKKRKIFLQRFIDGKDAVPAFKAVVHALTDPDTLAKVQEAFMEAKGTPADSVSFSVGGIDLWKMPEVFDWWGKYFVKKSDEPCTAVDMITGELCVPVRLWRKLPGKAAPGGQSAGVSLVSFNGDVYNSFDKENGENFPVSEETQNAIMDAAIHLALKAPLIGNIKLLHWYDRDMPQKDDVLGYILGGWDFAPAGEGDDKSEDAKDLLADELLTSPFKGTPPPDLANIQYHIAYFQPQAARMNVRRYEVGNYADVYNSVRSWFDGLQIVTSSGYVSGKLPKLRSMLHVLLTEAEKAKGKDSKKKNPLTPLNPFLNTILDSCFFGTPLPEPIVCRAMKVFRSGMYPGAGQKIDWGAQYRRMQWIKLWINQNKKGVNKNMPQIGVMLDSESTYLPYVCGRLLAVYDLVQNIAVPDMNSTVLSRFYTSCSHTPLQVLHKLQDMSVHHLEKIENRYLRNVLVKELEACWSRVTGPIPQQLSIQEQAYFDCGYWHERAAFRRQRSEDAKKKKIKEESTND